MAAIVATCLIGGALILWGMQVLTNFLADQKVKKIRKEEMARVAGRNQNRS